MPSQPITSFTTPANGTAGIWELLTTLTLATVGGVVTQWSDGTNYSGIVSVASNPFTAGSGSGLLALGNSLAWFVVRNAGSTVWWLFQRTSDTSWTVYRGTDAFLGGTPDFDTIPTSTTQALLTSATPGTLWNATPGRLFISCDALADATYGWTMFTVVAGGGNVCTILQSDKFAANMYASTNQDPVVSLGYFNATGFTAISFTVAAATTAIGFVRYRAGLGGANNVRIIYSTIYYATTGAPVSPPQTSVNQPGPEPNTGLEVAPRIMIFKVGTTGNDTGIIGWTGRQRWSTVFGRANGQTLTDGTNYWIFMCGVWVLWDSSTPAP